MPPLTALLISRPKTVLLITLSGFPLVFHRISKLVADVSIRRKEDSRRTMSYVLIRKRNASFLKNFNNGYTLNRRNA